MTFYVYKVTTCKGESWEGSAASMDAACDIARSVFLCPKRAIIRCELVKVLDGKGVL